MARRAAQFSSVSSPGKPCWPLWAVWELVCGSSKNMIFPTGKALPPSVCPELAWYWRWPSSPTAPASMSAYNFVLRWLRSIASVVQDPRTHENIEVSWDEQTKLPEGSDFQVGDKVGAMGEFVDGVFRA